MFKFQDRKGNEEVGKLTSRYCLNISAFVSFGVFWVPEAFFPVSWERKKTSGNGGQLTDRAAPIGVK